MEEFPVFFEAHLVDELAAIQELVDYPITDSEDSEWISDMFDHWRNNTITKNDYRTGVVPFLLMNHDTSTLLEAGGSSDWPPLDPMSSWALKSADLLGWFHHGPVWRFASCDIHGNPQGLYAFDGQAGWEALAFRVLLTSAALLGMHYFLFDTLFGQFVAWWPGPNEPDRVRRVVACLVSCMQQPQYELF